MQKNHITISKILFYIKKEIKGFCGFYLPALY